MSSGNGSKVDRPQEQSPVDFQTHVIEIAPNQFKGMFFADGVEHVLDFTLTSAEEMHIALLRAVQNYYRHRI